MRIFPIASPARLPWNWVVVFTGFLLLLNGCATSGSETTQSQRAKQEFEKSMRDASLGMREKQIAHLQEAVQLSPKDLNYRLALGLVYLLTNAKEKAEQEYLQILKINAKYKPALRELGRFYLNRGDWARAEENFEAVLNGPGTTADPLKVYNWLALCYYNQQKLPEAEQTWLKAINISENAEIRYNLALAYKEQERFDLAQESLERAVALKPDFIQALFELAQIKLKNADRDQATKYFEEVIRLDSNGRWGESSREYLNLLRQR
ncbi:MAG: tetratricopeptide repeat protein [Candidatus Marinimicrobia bacterium]|nr:tetratricopeptide repeat protein [Candidatus Neomarinimicrobiota bacterium]